MSVIPLQENDRALKQKVRRISEKKSTEVFLNNFRFYRVMSLFEYEMGCKYLPASISSRKVGERINYQKSSYY